MGLFGPKFVGYHSEIIPHWGNSTTLLARTALNSDLNHGGVAQWQSAYAFFDFCPFRAAGRCLSFYDRGRGVRVPTTAISIKQGAFSTYLMDLIAI